MVTSAPDRNSRRALSARERWLLARLDGRYVLDIGFAGQKAHLPAYYGRLDGTDRVVFGIDFAEAMVRERRQPRSIVGDAARLPIPDAAVDAIILGEFLEHHDNIVPFIRECRRVLRTGGQLLMTTPNPYFANRVVRNWLLPWAPHHHSPSNVRHAMGYEDHAVIWDPLSLAHLLGRQGFEVREMTALGTWIPGLGRLLPAFRRGLYVDRWPFNRVGYISCIAAVKR